MIMEKFAQERLAICENCPIVKKSKVVGLQCDSNRYLSPDGKEASYFPKDGWTKGCGCSLQHKAQQVNSHCPAHKW